MVQYVFTPWRDRHELLLVRSQFYDSDNNTAATATNTTTVNTTAALSDSQDDGHGQLQQQRQLKEQAVARVSMWMQRGNCPHMVESTALLTSAMLSDGRISTGASTYAVRAAYSAAFSRFVTGLLDSHQDKLRKQSMYSIAKVIGLPATFVELRHQATHEQLPSLGKLRTAANKGLVWIWDYYWKHLSAEDDDTQQTGVDTCKELVMKYLREDDETRRAKVLLQMQKWNKDELLQVVADLQKTLPGNQVFIKCARLSQEIRTMEDIPTTDSKSEAIDDASSKSDARSEADAHEEIIPGWSQYKGPWKAKPIGVV